MDERLPIRKRPALQERTVINLTFLDGETLTSLSTLITSDGRSGFICFNM